MPSGTREAAAPQRRSVTGRGAPAETPIPVITNADVVAARRLISGRIHRTPLVTSRTLGEICGNTRMFLKMENFQRTGSFKPRGALNKVLHLSDEQKRAGLVAASAGNHAQAVAYAGTSEGVKVVVVMPETAPQSKVEASRRYGAEVVLMPSFAEAFRKADELRDKFFNNMSKRAQERVLEEMDLMGPVRVIDVQAAQNAIVDEVLRLEEAGELIIEGRGGSETVVM